LQPRGAEYCNVSVTYIVCPKQYESIRVGQQEFSRELHDEGYGLGLGDELEEEEEDEVEVGRRRWKGGGGGEDT
jgi:hypothetical protein